MLYFLLYLPDSCSGCLWELQRLPPCALIAAAWRPSVQAMAGELSRAEGGAEDAEASAELCAASEAAFEAALCARNPLVKVCAERRLGWVPRPF